MAFAHANKPKRIFVSHMSKAWCPLYPGNEVEGRQRHKKKKKGVAFVSPSLNCTPIFTVNSERKGYWHRIYMLCFLFFWKYKGGGSKWFSKVIRIVRWYRETLGDCYLSLIWKDTNFYQTASSLSFARKSVSESIWAAKSRNKYYKTTRK